MNVIFRISDTTSVTVEAEENLLGYIKTEVHSNSLEIGLRHGTTCLDFNEPSRIIVTAPSLNDLALFRFRKHYCGGTNRRICFSKVEWIRSHNC